MMDVLGAVLARILDLALEVGFALAFRLGFHVSWPVALLLVVLWEINAMDSRVRRLERPKSWWER